MAFLLWFSSHVTDVDRDNITTLHMTRQKTSVMVAGTNLKG